MAGLLNPEDTETFVVGTKDVVEYLDATDNEVHDNIRQAVCTLSDLYTVSWFYTPAVGLATRKIISTCGHDMEMSFVLLGFIQVMVCQCSSSMDAKGE